MLRSKSEKRKRKNRKAAQRLDEASCLATKDAEAAERLAKLALTMADGVPGTPVRAEAHEFLGRHYWAQDRLLEAGYHLVAAVRTLARVADVRDLEFRLVAGTPRARSVAVLLFDVVAVERVLQHYDDADVLESIADRLYAEDAIEEIATDRYFGENATALA